MNEVATTCTVTEAAVEAALATWYGSPYPTGWDNPDEDRRDMRRVLEDFAAGTNGRGSDDG